LTHSGTAAVKTSLATAHQVCVAALAPSQVSRSPTSSSWMS
jgi:hypothetical protein